MRTRLARLALLGLALGLTLALAELLAPLASPRRCGGEPSPLWRPDRRLGWALIPGASGDAIVCAGSRTYLRQPITINALGLRDRPRAYARSGARRRVLVLGDSFVEALQVPLADTFTARLEARLGIEVLNAGVSGYATDNALRAYLWQGRRFAPDAVLLVVQVGNDVLDDGPRLYLRSAHGLPPKTWLHARRAGTTLAACLAAHRALARAAAAIPTAAWERSRVVRAAASSWLPGLLGSACRRPTGPRFADGRVPEFLGVYGAPQTPAWHEAWATTERLLVKLARRARRDGVSLGVALAPACFEFDPAFRWYEAGFPASGEGARDWDYPHARLAATLTREGVSWRSLAEPLRAAYDATGRSGCVPWDGHWNAEGHARVAEALAPLFAALAGGSP